MWNISELEDENQELSVSAMPVFWEFMQNMKIFCYWPKTNPTRKIKELQIPEDDWLVYKCRVLLNGATFDTYEAAKEAEKICENVSTISEFKKTKRKLTGGNNRRKNKLMKVTDSDGSDDTEEDNEGFLLNIDNGDEGNSSLKIRNSQRIKKDKNEVSDFLITDFEESDMDEDDDENDNDDYNWTKDEKNEKKRNKKSRNFVVEDLDDDIMEEEGDVEKYNEKNDDELLNKAIGEEDPRSVINTEDDARDSIEFITDGILTSTQIENVECPQNDATRILSYIENIDMSFSFFYNDVREKLVQFKKMVEVSLAAGDETIVFTTKTNLSAPEVKKKKNPELNVPERKILNSTMTFTPEVKGKTTSNANVLERNNLGAGHSKAFPIGEESLDQNYIFIPETNVPENKNVGARHSMAVAPSEERRIDRNNTLKSGIELKIGKIERFDDSETILDANGSIRDTFINYLSGLDYDNKKDFMYGVIEEVFDEEFFMHHVSWKKERNRVLLKDSHILTCWIKSFFIKFGSEITSEEVHAICTNYKGKNRKASKKGGSKKCHINKQMKN